MALQTKQDMIIYWKTKTTDTMKKKEKKDTYIVKVYVGYIASRFFLPLQIYNVNPLTGSSYKKDTSNSPSVSAHITALHLADSKRNILHIA